MNKYIIIIVLIISIFFFTNLDKFSNIINLDILDKYKDLNHIFDDDNHNIIDGNYGSLDNKNNFRMGNNSILRSISNILSKEECFNKFSRSDINGVSFNNKTNECKMYFYASKGLTDPDYESYIYNLS